MKLINGIKEKIKRNRYGKRFLEQYDFKTAVLSFCALVINVGFAIANLVSAVLYDSFWYGALSGYYFALILFRAVVISRDIANRSKNEKDDRAYFISQNKIYLTSGAFLAAIDIVMGIVVTQTVVSKSPAQSGMIMAIATATYTFYKIIMAIINLFRAKKHGDPVAQSLRNLNFAAACMSMVSLTAMMLTTFGKNESASSVLALKSCAGFLACAAVLVMATVMMIKASNALKKARLENITPADGEQPAEPFAKPHGEASEEAESEQYEP